MSTLQRLDPTVRQDRAWRSNTVRRLYNASALLFNQHKVSEGAVLQLLANWAANVRRQPYTTGATKQDLFINRIPKEI